MLTSAPVRIVKESGRLIAQVARDLGVNEGTLGNWVVRDREANGERHGALSEDERGELARLTPQTLTTRSNIAHLTATPTGE